MADLVIFDCDGVLVDSETIFARVLGECLTDADFPATAEEALLLGFGKNRDTLTAAVATRYGRALPEGFFEAMRERSALVLEHELKPIAGVAELLTALTAARCVASNGHLQRVRERLVLTGLLRFSSRMSSARRRSRSASRRPICFCWRRAGSAPRRPHASWSRTALSGLPPRSPPACRSWDFAAAAIAPWTTPSSSPPPAVRGCFHR